MEFLALWLIFGIAAALIGSQRGGNGCLWFGAGLVLGPIGLVLAFVVPGEKCPSCKSNVHPEATVCPKCSREIPSGGSQPHGRSPEQYDTWTENRPFIKEITVAPFVDTVAKKISKKGMAETAAEYHITEEYLRHLAKQYGIEIQDEKES